MPRSSSLSKSMVTENTRFASSNLATVLQPDLAIAINGSVTNPPTNRGLELQDSKTNKSATAFVHWIQCIIHDDINRLADFIAATLKRTPQYNFERTTTRGKAWQNSVSFSCGTKIFYDDADNGVNHCLLVITGSICEELGTESCYRVIRGLQYAFKAKFTRIDCKVRVSQELVSLDTVIQAGLDHNYKQVRTAPTSHVSRDFQGDKVQEYWTHEFGSRQSQSMTRFYNPAVKHKIAGYVDIEAELKDYKAIQVAEYFTSMPNGIPRDVIGMTIASIALGQLDFIDRAADKNVSRCPRLAWWQDVIEVLVGMTIKLQAPVYKPTFEKFVSFCERQVITGLTAYKKYVGTKRFHAWLRSVMAEKQERLPRRWENLIDDATMQEVIAK